MRFQPPATAGGSDLLMQILFLVFVPRHIEIAVAKFRASSSGTDVFVLSLFEQPVCSVADAAQNCDPKPVPKQRRYQPKQPEKQHYTKNNAKYRYDDLYKIHLENLRLI
jgi:hypothetical protein